jgi:hypothetical protein
MANGAYDLNAGPFSAWQDRAGQASFAPLMAPEAFVMPTTGLSFPQLCLAAAP